MITRKRRKYRKLTLDDTVLIVHLLLEGRSRNEIAVGIGCSLSHIKRVQFDYCDLEVIRKLTLKKDAKRMAILLEAYAKEPKIPGL